MFKKLFGKDKEVNKETQLYAPLTGEYVNTRSCICPKNDG